MSSQPVSVKQVIARGIAAWERDEYVDALGSFREVLREHPDFADVRNRAGLCLAMLGDMEGALREFDHAVTVNPAYAEAHLNRAIVLNHLARYDEARDAFDRAGELDAAPGQPFRGDLGNRIATAHARLADLYREGDRLDRAVEEYRRALELRPGFLDVRARLAETHLQAGDASRARAELEAILSENPHFTEARLRLGVALQRLGDVAGAVREWERCAQDNPGDPRIRAYLASGRGSGGEGDAA